VSNRPPPSPQVAAATEMQGTVVAGIKLQTLQIIGRRADQRLTSAVIRPEERNKKSEKSHYYGQSRNVLLSHCT
jgi:hypothetical protein